MTEPSFPELRARFREDPRSLLGAIPGILAVDKPSGPTSHDMVNRARRRFRLRRVGHGGTLDPMATGLLLLLLGSATRLFDDLQVFRKTYRARFRLGLRTDTQDRTGETLAVSPPEALPLAQGAVEDALGRFRGVLFQTPPMYSALKRGGRKLVDLARRGATVEREPREVEVYDATLTTFDGVEGEIELAVSKGLYVRTLIDDLGLALGVGAVMTELRRTAIGPFDLADAVAADEV